MRTTFYDTSMEMVIFTIVENGTIAQVSSVCMCLISEFAVRLHQQQMTELVRLSTGIKLTPNGTEDSFPFMCATQTVTAFNFWINSQQRSHIPDVIGSFHIWFSYCHWKWKCWKAFIEYIGHKFFAHIRLRLFDFLTTKMVYSVQCSTLCENTEYSRTEEKAAWVESIKFFLSFATETRFFFDWT